jgi:hypothetical protein
VRGTSHSQRTVPEVIEGTGARAALVRDRRVRVDESRRKRVCESTCQREREGEGTTEEGQERKRARLSPR